MPAARTRLELVELGGDIPGGEPCDGGRLDALVALALVTVLLPQKESPELIAKVVPEREDPKPKKRKLSVQKLAKQATSSSSPSSSAAMIQANATVQEGTI